LGRDRDLLVMQSTLGATLTLSVERIVATAVGHRLERSRQIILIKSGRVRVAIFLVELLSIAFRLEKTAYRYTRITLTIIVLIPRSAPP